MKRGGGREGPSVFVYFFVSMLLVIGIEIRSAVVSLYAFRLCHPPVSLPLYLSRTLSLSRLKRSRHAANAPQTLYMSACCMQYVQNAMRK